MTRCFSAWDADSFPGLFRPWVEGGIRCDSSKTDERSLSQPVITPV